MRKRQVNIQGIFADYLSDQPQEARYTLLLGALHGDLKLLIITGLAEAQAIALALKGSILERPLMHDLFKETLLKVNYNVQEVLITDLKDDIFFAVLCISNTKSTYILDSCPSDSITISLCLGASIFVADKLLNQIIGKTLVYKFEPSESKQVGAKMCSHLQYEAKIENFENPLYESYRNC